MQDVMLAQLKGVTLFQAVEERDLTALAARATRRRLEAGKLVFKEGSAADSLWVVLSGSVKIYMTDAAGKEVLLDTKKAGEYFGEMMLDHRPRSASIVTLEPCEFAVIGREDFRAFLSKHPQAAEQLILNLIRVTRGMNDRVKHYVKGLEDAKAPDLPAVKRWLVAKRWVLAGLLVLALAQFYFMDVFLQILSMPSLTVFPGH
jgi:signal-transduction protein with cAMP-binding, CBS, and nucleotidyltransferase domain